MSSVKVFQIPEHDSKNPTPWKENPSLPPEWMKPKILSVVASVSLGQTLNLKDIAKKATNLSYNEDSFTPLVMRITNPVATAMVFKTGKMVVTGTQSEAQCRTAVKKFTGAIRACGYGVKAFGVRIQNITASVNVGFRVCVPKLGADNTLKTWYNPEMFTGATIELGNPKSKVMVFRTGSVLITGVRTEEDVHEVFRIVYPLIKLHAADSAL